MLKKTLEMQLTDDNVVPLFPDLQTESVEPEPEAAPLTSAEITKLRVFLAEFAIIRATCPLAIRSLSGI